MSYPIWDQGKRARKSRLHIADAILFLAIGSSPAAAQQAAESSENVTVFAPYLVKKKTGPRHVQTISVSRDVNIHDLDLTKPRDVTALEQRVKQAAQDVCCELDSRYSNGDRRRMAEDRFCARNASLSALAEIQMVSGRRTAQR